MSDSVRPHRRQPTRLLCPWDSPGKNTGVGCHFLLQCMKVKSESDVAQSCLTLRDPRTAAHQSPPSMGFSRQECWSGVPLPSLILYLDNEIYLCSLVSVCKATFCKWKQTFTSSGSHWKEVACQRQQSCFLPPSLGLRRAQTPGFQGSQKQEPLCPVRSGMCLLESKPRSLPSETLLLRHCCPSNRFSFFSHSSSTSEG